MSYRKDKVALAMTVGAAAMAAYATYYIAAEGYKYVKGGNTG